MNLKEAWGKAKNVFAEGSVRPFPDFRPFAHSNVAFSLARPRAAREDPAVTLAGSKCRTQADVSSAGIPLLVFRIDADSRTVRQGDGRGSRALFSAHGGRRWDSSPICSNPPSPAWAWRNWPGDWGWTCTCSSKCPLSTWNFTSPNDPAAPEIYWPRTRPSKGCSAPSCAAC